MQTKRPQSNTHQVLGGDGLSGAARPHDHAGQSVLHVLQAVSQSQDCHDLAGHRNVEASLERGNKKKGNHTQYKPQGQQIELVHQRPAAGGCAC